MRSFKALPLGFSLGNQNSCGAGATAGAINGVTAAEGAIAGAEPAGAGLADEESTDADGAAEDTGTVSAFAAAIEVRHNNKTRRTHRQKNTGFKKDLCK